MSHYDTLGVSKTATPEEIKNAYRAQAKKYHPDVFEGSTRVSENVMRQINEAYAVLSDADKRAKYDLTLGESDDTPAKKAKSRKRSRASIEIFMVLLLLTVAVVCAVYIMSGMDLPF